MRFLFLIVVGVLFTACGSTTSTVVDAEKIKALDALVAQKNFEIVSDWAYPLANANVNAVAISGLLPPGSNANSISLVGNPNHLRIHGDSVSISLPYFGERQLPGSYNPRTIGFEYDGIAERLNVKYNEKKQRYLINFYIKNREESCKVMLILFPDLESDLIINSSHRTTISYRGNVSQHSENTTTITENE
ncbi:DUF4251 domain-containing protein [Aquimarina aggregata]|uniref:DUF4251 domain-containing protein n=1 Tax=Aquimarina aggregata TaxID=1642818 RepID=UPI00248FE619|nr:DUF4251 domain-containing protein [Aquimarina aggregata]